MGVEWQQWSMEGWGVAGGGGGREGDGVSGRKRLLVWL